MEEEIIQEIRENETVEEEEDEEDEEGGDDENEIAVKPIQKEIQQAVKRLVNFPTFTENGEIRAIALKASSLMEVKLNHSMRQRAIVDFFKMQ